MIHADRLIPEWHNIRQESGVEPKTATAVCHPDSRRSSCKSSEEGLNQEFNSLDAKRKACEVYMVGQRHAGWIACHIGRSVADETGGREPVSGEIFLSEQGKMQGKTQKRIPV